MKHSLLFLIVLSLGCAATQNVGTPAATENHTIVHGKLFTAAYQQRAAEYRASCYQAYNFAKLRLDQMLADNASRPRAIVTDIDETVLDNSAYAVKQSLENKDYQIETWHQWTSLGQADTVPGALAFLSYAASKGVEVFYVTNRDEVERPGTLANLKRFNFPFADNNHLVLKQNTSSKEARRMEVAKTHDILMLLGDNLADFSMLWDKKTTAERNDNVDKNAGLFGSRFIIIPNPVYGDWEGAIYKYNWNLNGAQRDSAIKSVLKSY